MVEVVIVVLATTVDQKVFLFPDHVLTHVFRHFEIWRKLNCVGGAGFFTKATHNAARKIDSEKLGIPAAVVHFSFL